MKCALWVPLPNVHPNNRGNLPVVRQSTVWIDFATPGENRLTSTVARLIYAPRTSTPYSQVPA